MRLKHANKIIKPTPYVPSSMTNLWATFRKVRAQLAEEAKPPRANVKQIRKAQLQK
jgi:hypothetical protein